MKKSYKKSILVFLLVIASLLQLVGMTVVASESPFYVEGAQIRASGKQGIRFVAYLEKWLYDLTYGEDANFGILIARKDKLSADTEITMENATAVPARNLFEDTDSYCRFSAVITEQPAEFYGVELVARAYVVVGGTVYYSDQISRSIKQVAEMILEQNRDPDDVAIAKEVLARYQEVGADFLVHADDLWNKLVVYPEYPEQIARDYMYSVTVEQGTKSEELTVYNQTEAYFYQDRFDGGDVNRRFCEFAFSGKPVTVHVRVNSDFDTYAVVPTSKGFASTYADGVISVTLTKPEQVLIILDDDVNTALSVFADAPETDVPVKGAKNVIYVEGWNQITNNADGATLENGVLTINGQKTQLYLAPGAVLTARVVTTTDAYQAKIFGRGALLDPASLIYQESEHGFDNETSDSAHFVRIQGYTSTIKDVKLLDSRGYNLNITRGNCTVQNVKILSTMMTTDGITTSAEGGSGIVKDCFVYCGDNALVPVVDVTKEDAGYSFTNITVGTTCSAIYPQSGVRSTFTDIYVFRADESLITMKEVSNHAKYLTVNNLDALDCVRTPRLFYATNQGSAEKVVTLNKVLMRYTTGAHNVTAEPGTATNEKTLIEFYGDAGSNYTINATDLYVGGNLITSKDQILISGSSALTLSLAQTAEVPAVLSGSRFVVKYKYTSKVMLGDRELFLDVKPVKKEGTWYLPYGEIASYLAVEPKNPVTTQIDGVEVEMISLSNLIASGAVTAAGYSGGVIQLTPAIGEGTNLLKEDYSLSSNYNLMYYRSRTPYMVADYENGVWVYSAASENNDGDAGIFRMILDEYRQYGAGTYKLTFEYESNVTVTVELGKDHDFVFCGTASSYYTSKTITIELSDDPTELEQLAICFKIPTKKKLSGKYDEPGTLSIKNISLVKIN